MLLSVVVVNWNSIDDLRKCLVSLREQTYPKLEIIVVDNGSSDGSADMVALDFPDFRLLREHENLGFAEACNRGIAVSTGEWVAMLNNDAIAEPTWATAIVEAAQLATPECGMLQSLLLYQSRPDVINSTGIELARSGGGRDRCEGKPRESSQEEQEIFCPTAGAAAYRRSMLEQIRISGGYFDRSHFMYYEDTDLGWRARLAGFSARYIPTSVVYHRWHGSTERLGRSWLTVIGSSNRIRTLLKNATPGMLLRTFPKTVAETYGVLRHGGPKGAGALIKAVQDGLAARKEVDRVLRVSRREVETRWCSRR